jgi:hypothetical protein
MSFFYFSTAIYFSHYAYRHFKAISQEGMLGGMNFMPPNNPNADANNDGGDYRRVQEPPANNNFVAFQGQGVRLG